jgi:acetyl esterase/lipase
MRSAKIAVSSLAGALIIALASHAPAFAQTQPTFPNVPYATVGTQQMRLDLYLPPIGTAQPPFPCVINIHGGGWSGGNRFPINSVMTTLRNSGFAIASVSYRLTSQAGQYGPGVSVTFPAQIHDVKGAARWLRAHAAQYGLDPARFGSYGTSAGGHLSALLGASGNVAALEGNTGGNLAHSSRVQAAADYFGPTDIININLDVTDPPGSGINHDAPNSPESRLVDWDQPGQGMGDIRANLANPTPPYPALVALSQQVNPITFISMDDPSFFIGHGMQDVSVPLMQSQRLANALASIGHPHTFMISPTAGHGALGQTINDETVEFFRRVLRKPGDVDTNGVVDVGDLLAVIVSWGPCPIAPQPETCLADVSPHAIGNGAVDVADLLSVISNWG